MKKILFTACLSLGWALAFSQGNVAINDNNFNPEASAMLDVNSSTKGFLAPRMTTVQRTAIAFPAAGLMVYDTNVNAYYIWNGSAWTQLGGGGAYTGGTGISVTGNTINNTGDLSNTNEIQTLSIAGNTLSLSNGGGSVTLPNGGGGGFSLPYTGAITDPTTAFFVSNLGGKALETYSTNVGPGLRSVGNGTTIGGEFVSDNGTALMAKTDGQASAPQLDLVENSNIDYARARFGNLNSGSNGHWLAEGYVGNNLATDRFRIFKTNAGGTIPFTLTSQGNVGINKENPTNSLDVVGNALFTSNGPQIELHQSSLATISSMKFSNEGATGNFTINAYNDDVNGSSYNYLFFKHSSSPGSLFWINSAGRAFLGDSDYNRGGDLTIQKNSSINDAQLLLYEQANDFARIDFSNSAEPNARWTLAGYTNPAPGSAYFNIYHPNVGNVVSCTGTGNVGIGTNNTPPSEKLDVAGNVKVQGNLIGMANATLTGTMQAYGDVNAGGNVNVGNEVNKAATGSANLIPLAYGKITFHDNGLGFMIVDAVSGTGNFSVVSHGDYFTVEGLNANAANDIVTFVKQNSINVEYVVFQSNVRFYVSPSVLLGPLTGTISFVVYRP